ncbi:MAG: sulfotransferase family protein [Pseudomonadota bacterium]
MTDNAEPILLYCVGATKAGTSWLYRTLADRGDVALSAVKETHFWDKSAPDTREKWIATLGERRARFREALSDAEARGIGWKARNMARQIEDVERLLAMLADGSREAYLAYLRSGATEDTRLIGDICPAYSLLDAPTYREMAGLTAQTRFLYLVREPVARLWSAVRMQADRQLGPGETIEEKANNILWRILNRNAETHLTARGTYGATITRLREAVAPANLRVMYMEELLTDAGYAALCGWLGLPPAPAPLGDKVHAGQRVALRPQLAARAAEHLAQEYAFAEEAIGPLPEAWQARRP